MTFQDIGDEQTPNLKQRKQNRKTQSASVRVIENQPKGAQVSQAAFMAQVAAQPSRTTEDNINFDGVSGVAVHTRPGTTVMYKRTEHVGWIPRVVSNSAVPQLFANGWQAVCPECGAHHMDSQGNVDTSPNACAARDPVMYRRCPVCRKRIWDTQSYLTAVMPDDEEDPNEIRESPYGGTSPEERTKGALDLHMWIRHPQTAQQMGVPPLPHEMREMVGAARERGT